MCSSGGQVEYEKLDGSGYPWRVKEERLEAAARILAVVDIFEALTADRPYRTGMPVAKALSILQSEAGSRLCPSAIEGLAAYLADAG